MYTLILLADKEYNSCSCQNLLLTFVLWKANMYSLRISCECFLSWLTSFLKHMKDNKAMHEDLTGDGIDILH